MAKSTKHEDYQHAVFLIVLSLPPSEDQKPSSAPYSLTNPDYVLLLILETKFHIHTPTGNIIFLVTLILMVLHSKREGKRFWTD